MDAWHDASTNRVNKDGTDVTAYSKKEQEENM